MVLKDKTQRDIELESDKLNKVKILFFKKLITRSEAIDMLRKNGYGHNGAEFAIRYLESLDNKVKKDILNNISTSFIDKTINKYNKDKK